MPEYRIRKNIDVTLSLRGSAGENCFRALQILGTSDNVPTILELEEAGFTVEEVSTPEEDLPGTVRRYGAVWYIKDLDGNWFVARNGLTGPVRHPSGDLRLGEVVRNG